jgi:hypothetical protein
MFRAFVIPILVITSSALYASGPYSPVTVGPQRDEAYNIGKAIYLGDVKLGSGSSCAECHTKKEALNRKRLSKVKYSLESRISNCVQIPDRVHGTIESNQMGALVRYLAKRYGL